MYLKSYLDSFRIMKSKFKYLGQDSSGLNSILKTIDHVNVHQNMHENGIPFRVINTPDMRKTALRLAILKI